ncbi:hypothetical protein [Lysinibacillus pakistanensis]|uniref:hypothetical protein n=1 Tax=Lysinibacillus pakistanensis TaxID=759811 RepID=UPI003D27AF09
MSEFERMKKQSEQLEKFVKWFLVFVFIAILIGWIVQVTIGVYFIKNPDSIGSWFGQIFKGATI